MRPQKFETGAYVVLSIITQSRLWKRLDTELNVKDKGLTRALVGCVMTCALICLTCIAMGGAGSIILAIPKKTLGALSETNTLAFRV